MSLRSMEFSAVLLFAVCSTLMTYLTFGKERERAMLFPDYYFFAEKRLANHTIDEKYVKNLDDCELLCYLNDNCVSANFKKDLEKIPSNTVFGHLCELNNATHLTYERDLIADTDYYYRGSKNACDKSSRCENNATCQSGFTHKGYKCLCPIGFDGEHCENDIDECKTLGNCHVNATCNNTYGSYTCTCKPGYTRDGQNCTDVDECKGNNSCHKNANCTNTIGSHLCECHRGYTGNGQNCTDTDECTIKTDNCHENASCSNTQGSFNCTCLPNYIGNGRHCKVDPCHHYTNLSDADRKSSYVTPSYPVLCDDQLLAGWYRFVGAAGTKMPTSRVPAFRCGTDKPGWLSGAHPMVRDVEVHGQVCFSGKTSGCEHLAEVSVKNCGSYFIYKLKRPSVCNSRYCGTN